ncbi:diguanylate cyclase [Lederbergia wuyishanensis]|uniref:Diguanylate cyclase (GGDEF)-like protein n=1 Tax=Lederbergia wuyishanensis TaxID=1347903 RepID=A0ABU0D5X3_9BACI|nr:diguanylate cyclase [Lederbergia wuyishanensis]MCJ8008380.1 diguanylate cyclase [Lederbergia wuyishanensis]MDQ0343794.1 diguanylate cyclase (GGDEF)-like protein [Lederbergia wuyishanensis]
MPNFDKYYSLIKERIRNTFLQWKNREEITEKEIYLFLHNLKGTAGTIGIEQIATIANEKLQLVSESSLEQWKTAKWMSFLEELNSLTIELPSIPEFKKIEDTNHFIEDKTILLIDAEVDFVTSIKEDLESQGFHVMIALNIDKGLELFYMMRPSLVMLDINIKESHETSILEKMVSATSKSFTPIVIVSNENTLENRIMAYSIGATDFISKPIQNELFIPFILNRMRTQQNIQKAVIVDELTGVYNRKHLINTLVKAMKTFARNQRPLSVCIIDLDHLKQVNQQFGHVTGDEVLKSLASVINESKRESDLLFRYGGDEFLLYMPDTNSEKAMALIERISTTFQKKRFVDRNNEFSLTFSVGIAEINEKNNTTDGLLDQATKALLESKNSGRNNVTIFSQHNESSIMEKLHFIIIDDDYMVRTILEKSLSSVAFGRNISVIIHSFEDGIQFLNSPWYHKNDKYIILLDGIMPKMDGIEILTKIRKDYPDKNIVISMLSARSSEKNIIQALEKGADDYMLKPFNIPEVVARLGRLAQRMLL